MSNIKTIHFGKTHSGAFCDYRVEGGFIVITKNPVGMPPYDEYHKIEDFEAALTLGIQNASMVMP